MQRAWSFTKILILLIYHEGYHATFAMSYAFKTNKNLRHRRKGVSRKNSRREGKGEKTKN